MRGVGSSNLPVPTIFKINKLRNLDSSTKILSEGSFSCMTFHFKASSQSHHQSFFQIRDGFHQKRKVETRHKNAIAQNLTPLGGQGKREEEGLSAPLLPRFRVPPSSLKGGAKSPLASPDSVRLLFLPSLASNSSPQDGIVSCEGCRCRMQLTVCEILRQGHYYSAR